MDRTLSKGMNGQDVRELQDDLNRHIPGAALKVDGIFGARTDARVREFQRARGLTQDGLVGPKTKALLKLKAGPLGIGGGPKLVGDSRLLLLNPVFFRSTAADLGITGITGTRWDARLSEAKLQWGKLGVQIVSASPEIVTDAKLKTAGGNKAERDQIYALRPFRNETAWVFVVDNNVDDEGGAYSQRPAGLPQGKIVLSNRGASVTLLAHEVGHVLGLGHPPLADVNTVMSNTGHRDLPNPRRNTMGNFSRLKDWPTSGFEVTLNPDP
jgi:hypothetical protein